MIQEHKRNTNIGVGFGVIVQLVGQTLLASGDTVLFGLLFVIIGTALFIWGCVQYAKGKGYSGFLGILGLLSILGLILLAILPDKRKESEASK